VTDLGQGIFQVVAAYGYMQTPNVFEVFECCAAAGLSTQREQFTYYLGRETLLTTGPSSMIQWRKKLFSFMSRNAQPATSFFGIPPERVMEVGLQLEV
jgi:KUP system potassium uptake protein